MCINPLPRQSSIMCLPTEHLPERLGRNHKKELDEFRAAIVGGLKVLHSLRDLSAVN